MGTKSAFLDNARGGIELGGIVRTYPLAVFAPHTKRRVDSNGAGPFVLDVSESRAFFLAGGVETMVAGQGERKKWNVWKSRFVEGDDLAPAHAGLKLVLDLTGDLTGVAACTSIEVENESLLHA